jgi:hypothetical protein
VAPTDPEDVVETFNGGSSLNDFEITGAQTDPVENGDDSGGCTGTGCRATSPNMALLTSVATAFSALTLAYLM